MSIHTSDLRKKFLTNDNKEENNTPTTEKTNDVTELASSKRSDKEEESQKELLLPYHQMMYQPNQTRSLLIQLEQELQRQKILKSFLELSSEERKSKIDNFVTEHQDEVQQQHQQFQNLSTQLQETAAFNQTALQDDEELVERMRSDSYQSLLTHLEEISSLTSQLQSFLMVSLPRL